jgi:purine-binding chemotaxis protein CheW
MTDPAPLPDKAADNDAVELLSFLVGDQDYCIDIMSVREIRGGATATPLPHSPSYMRGVINLRGAVLPIIDLSLRLGLPPLGDQARHVIIVVAIGDRTVGLVVDAVSDILAVPPGALHPPPDLALDTAAGFVSALTIVENRMIRVLDLTAVFPPAREDAA